MLSVSSNEFSRIRIFNECGMGRWLIRASVAINLLLLTYVALYSSSSQYATPPQQQLQCPSGPPSDQTIRQNKVEDFNAPEERVVWEGDDYSTPPLANLTEFAPSDDLSPPKSFYAQRGSYWVLYNYIRARKTFRRLESITYTTLADFTFLDNLPPLLQRWEGPVSLAVYAPGTDFHETLERIQYLRECLPNSRVKDYVTFHIFFDRLFMLRHEEIPRSAIPFHKYVCPECHRAISPPELSPEDSTKIRNIRNNSAGSTLLAEIVWGQITEIQGRDCHTPNFICGTSDDKDCGFFCQPPHQANCLMLSYVLNLPLIYDPTETFAAGWNEIFLPIGSDCLPGPNTFSWSWSWKGNLSRNSNNSRKMCPDSQEPNLPEIRYPLAQGLSVSEELAEAVAKVTPDEFIWLVEQFLKYTLRLNAHSQRIVEGYKRQIGFSSPIVGAYVLRIDEMESLSADMERQSYFQAAEEYFSREEESRGVKLPRRIFLATDDATYLIRARARWGFLWEIHGEEKVNANNATLFHTLGGIVRDAQLLSSCDFIICGLSSVHSTDDACLLKMIGDKEIFDYDKPSGESGPLADFASKINPI